MSLKAEEPTVDVLDLFPKGADTKPKEGEIQPSDFFKFEADMNCALSKIAPIDPTVPRRVGMRQLFTEETEWKSLAGNTFPDYNDYDPSTGRPKMKAWPTLPKRPDPGAEPRFRPPGENEDLSAVMAKLNQLHKEWETSRQDLKQYEAVEAGVFARHIVHAGLQQSRRQVQRHSRH